MSFKKIIPCLDCDLQVPEGRVVKGVEFKEIKYAGEPVELANKYCADGADELVMLDITASNERRATMVDVLERVVKDLTIPLCIGGGIKSVEDFKRMLDAGASKCSINTAAIKNPDLITEASNEFGSEAVVVAIDSKRRYVQDDEEAAKDKTIFEDEKGQFWFDTNIYGGNEFTGIDSIEWAKEVEKRGAGEILVTSMDGDGTKDGYDLVLTKAIVDAVDIPVTASGGVGNPEHILEAFTVANADAALAASIFHFDEYPVPEVKKYLKENGIDVKE